VKRRVVAPLVLVVALGGLFLFLQNQPARGSPWVDLARVALAGAPPGLFDDEVPLEGGRTARLVRVGDDQWLTTTLERAHWTAIEPAGRWRAELPVLSVAEPRAAGAPYRLTPEGGVGFEYQPDLEAFAAGPMPGRFATRVLELLLDLEPGAEPPARLELAACANYLSVGPQGLRVQGRRVSGAGFWVAPGRPRTLELELPPESALTFATVLEPVLGARAARLEPRTFRVRLDGAVLFEARQAGNLLGESVEWRRVELPRGGVRRARLSFEVDGALALGSFLAPVLGPAERGSPGERPWEAGSTARPDLVVFLADTFRADNLGVYGNTLALTPELDRFAAESRTFAHAWSTSTHTLPAHSSLFSGVFPRQNGQVDFFTPLPGAVETLAELLSAQGYRCGLVSDGVMVSRSHGLDQGFAFFDERREAGTVERARAFLAADDGRPVFLFVQTYAVHAPYACAPETRARLSDRLELAHDYEDVYRAALGLPRGLTGPPEGPGEAEVVRRLRDLYLAGVADLDALFGRFRGALEEQGYLDSGYLLFTSDHGESFFEHGLAFHANPVFETELRVPLLLHGPRAAVGREDRPVSLIDFAPTLAELAGLAAPARWPGRSLLAPDGARVVYGFQSRRADQNPTLAVIAGGRKLIGFEDAEAVREGRLFGAYDLDADPGERADLRAQSWAAELAAAERERLLEYLTPLVEAERASLTGDALDSMRALGYGGDGTDGRAPPSDER